MKKVIKVYKTLGKTPLQMLDQLRVDQPDLKSEKLSYAGRLDPMAEGLMLVLVGEANKEREEYLSLDKEYEFEMVLGISTDTYDLLGLVEETGNNVPADVGKMEKYLDEYVGKSSLPYPPYSSKTVQGKPLWLWSKEDRLDEIEIPENQFEIYELEMLELSEISASELLSQIKERIGLVEGDFRQVEIVEKWEEKLNDNRSLLPLIKARVSCSSGTYVRSIVQDVGEKLGVHGVTYSIKRIRIGDIKKV